MRESKPLQKKAVIRERTRCLGPTPDLEEHVEPDWWRRIFNSLYLKTDADVVDDYHITRTEVDLFSEILKLSPEDKILDLCCGTDVTLWNWQGEGFKMLRDWIARII